MSTKPFKACSECDGDGFHMVKVRDEDGQIMMYQRSHGSCNGFGILIRDPSRDSTETGLGYRKMRGLFAA